MVLGITATKPVADGNFRTSPAFTLSGSSKPFKSMISCMSRLNFCAMENTDSPGMTVYSDGGADVVVVEAGTVLDVDDVVVSALVDSSSLPRNDATMAAIEKTTIPAASDHWRRPRRIIAFDGMSRVAPRNGMGEIDEVGLHIVAKRQCSESLDGLVDELPDSCFCLGKRTRVDDDLTHCVDGIDVEVG